ncbi:Holliday junction branch migration protein RuvA [Bacillus sp. FJAT-49711]|uniref:Holliday junction branch migration protein RuvA n=1 Tax=Bacillus sp. FJAT-49711 TaxID=2833585 RepID=UPI001BC9B931|nr:Holliday junction branch migration protein RuvA [Bacillus sp. FJAT-49711]MBS4217026.1 Holliday junction branch migration protein RuvA [Bacillus sp. FJAT-49711]
MYEYIKGSIEYTGPEYIVIENNGIGYQVLTPNPYVFSGKQGMQTIIYTYQHVREDIIALYGFSTIEEKLMFRKLIGVSGIGPKGALAILAYGEPSQVIRAIENEDEKFLVKFPGVGKKTARQMILDLKGKLHDVAYDESPNLFTVEEQKPVSAKNKAEEALEEALLALTALGYSDRELKKIAPKLKDKEMTTDQYIKQALQMLMT